MIKEDKELRKKKSLIKTKKNTKVRDGDQRTRKAQQKEAIDKKKQSAGESIASWDHLQILVQDRSMNNCVKLFSWRGKKKKKKKKTHKNKKKDAQKKCLKHTCKIKESHITLWTWVHDIICANFIIKH